MRKVLWFWVASSFFCISCDHMETNKEKCLPGSQADFAWTSIDKKNSLPEKDLRGLFAIKDTREASIKKWVQMTKFSKISEHKYLKVYGDYSEEMSCNSDGIPSYTYTTRYEIISLTMQADKIQTCSVTRKVFFTDEARPDPFQESPGWTNECTCKDFLDWVEHKNAACN